MSRPHGKIFPRCAAVGCAASADFLQLGSCSPVPAARFLQPGSCSPAADGTPLHIRVDGPGLDSMDVPAFRTFPGSGGVNVRAGSNQFKLQFLIFVPAADVFARMRVGQAAQNLQKLNPNVSPDDNGLERFITATRRQNLLVPPRRHRSFPLAELT